MASYVGKHTDELIATARHLSLPGKGILAADETVETLGHKLESINVENTEANRRAYRELLFTTTAAHRYLNGAILHQETLYQRTSAGKLFVNVLKEGDVIPGVKVDTGTSEMPATGGETTTQGLDDLAERCQKYYDAGARFAKWRSVVRVEPSPLVVRHNAQDLGRYAIICQQNGLVPVIQPEVLLDGSHEIRKCAAVTEIMLAAVFKSLSDHRVLLEATILNPNMVTPGVDGPKCSSDNVAGYTLQALQRTVPVAVPGILFLSGGQSEEEATQNLNAINSMDAVKPWTLAFCYGRALQHSAVKAWGGRSENVRVAKRAFLLCCKANFEAALGRYTGGTSGDSTDRSSSSSTEELYAGKSRPRSSTESLFVKDYKC